MKKKPARKKPSSARPIPESAREYLRYLGWLGGVTSRRGLTKEQARGMVAIREAKRALARQGKSELTRERWPLKIEAKYTDIRKPAPRIVDFRPHHLKHKPARSR